MLDKASHAGVGFDARRTLMMRQPNPYRPGFNQPPVVLAGRDEALAGASEALDTAALDGRTPAPLVLIGSRGVGKTVLLGEIAHIAADRHGWLTAHVEVRRGRSFLGQLLGRLDAARKLLDEQPPSRRFEVSEVTARLGALGASVEGSLVRRRVMPPDADMAVEQAVTAAMAAAMTKDSGLVVSIDEVQLAPRVDLAELAAVLQQHVPDDWPLVVVLAGLADVRDRGRSVSYLERAEWHELGLLDRTATLYALIGPAASAGRPLTAEAAETLAQVSGGYPFAVQVLGHHAWRASAGSPTIELSHVLTALPAAESALEAGLYAGRWADASPKEREYLRVVASLVGGGVVATGAAVAHELGVPAKELSYLRDRLLKKGTLVAVGRELLFPVPSMFRWVLRQELAT